MRLRTMCFTAALLTAGLAQAAPRPFSHVFLMVLENHSLSGVLGNPNLPKLNRLATSYGLATNYTGVAHPSLPNYVALIAGSTFGSRSDDPTQLFDGPSLPQQLTQAGRSWKGYFQGLPQPGFDGPSSGLYAKKHNPFMLMRNLASDPAQAARTVPLEQLGADLAADQVPDLAFIVPDLCHDLHGAARCRGSALELAGDDFVKAWAGRVMASKAWDADAALVITFDEGSGGDPQGGGGRIATIVVRPQGPRGLRSAQAYNHYSLLRTLQDAWGLTPLGEAAKAQPMSDLFGW